MRIAKFIANAGYCSRRQAEALILERKVSVDGAIIASPALNITDSSVVIVEGKKLTAPQTPRLWLYHKPQGVLTTHYDPEGRSTVFDELPHHLPRVISVGRLDYNTEGLLLLTNNGTLSRNLELPSSGLLRKYRCRVFGHLNESHVRELATGISIEGIHYKPIQLTLVERPYANYWIEMSLCEGKNREIRKVLSYFGVEVSRLIRIEYGKFKLERLRAGEVREINYNDFKEYCLE